MESYSPAGFWRRFFALVYDVLIVISIILVGWVLLYAVLLGILGAEAVNEKQVLWHWGWGLIIKLYLLTLWFGYYAISWIKGGQTLGMRPWRLYVFTEQGKPLNWKNSLIRFASGLLGIGLLLIPFNQQKKALQDRLSGTITVVRNSR
ncbi:MAG TPA: RDD family protein [Aeromonadales bacterium]|nr:RDD family protein [Aeromonadales bacterium]